MSYAISKAIQFLAALEGDGTAIPKTYLNSLRLNKDLSKLSVRGDCYEEAVRAFLSCDRESGCYDCGTHDWFPTFDELMNQPYYADLDTTQKIEQLIVYLLQFGPKAFNSDIVAIDPKPTKENNYLWNEDRKEFSGVFVDKNGKRYSFLLKNTEGDSWSRVYGQEEYFPDIESLRN